MTSKEKNDHYGKINHRFEERSQILRDLGFKYECVPGYELAVFAHRPGTRKAHTIAAATVSLADAVVWEDYLADARRHANFTWK
jgi:hypothetical protein